MPLGARCARAEEEKRVLGVQPVRVRCGYRLCLIHRQATNWAYDVSHLERIVAIAGDNLRCGRN